MASFIYNSAVDDLAQGKIDFDGDDFKLLLVTGDYTANKDTHLTRDDVTDEVSGTGYDAGGKAIACTVAKDTANDRVTLTFASTSWAESTISANGGVIYVDRDGNADDDELVAFIDFGGTVSSTGATFTVGTSTITLQN